MGQECQARRVVQETDFRPNAGAEAVIELPVATNASLGRNDGTYRTQTHRDFLSSCADNFEWFHKLVAAAFLIRLCSTDTTNIPR
jgi:hypothetical protein